MPSLSRSSHVCRNCEFRSPKWLGRCPECGAWDALEELPARDANARRSARAAAAIPWPELAATPLERLSAGPPELDRVLGGGFVPGAAVLLGGEPGIGKSTLALQSAAEVARGGRDVLYVSGEESAAQLRARGDRLGVSAPRLHVAAETDVDALVELTRRLAPALVVVDSIQAVRVAELGAVAGSVSQVRESAVRLVQQAKQSGTPLVLVGHVTKDGSIAGPRALEHVVDVVLQFEGDRHHDHRVLRGLKNRFGAAHEIGVFRMTAGGLVEVPDPSEALLAERPHGAAGSAVLAAVEGTRPLLVEIQALAGEPVAGSPRRTALGVDPNRVALVLAVLERRTGLDLARRDVFVNVTGGLSIDEPAADLAVAVAVASSVLRRPLPPRAALFGELGLTGEVRAVSRSAARVREAQRLGFTTIVGPPGANEAGALAGIVAARDLEQVLRLLVALAPGRPAPSG